MRMGIPLLCLIGYRGYAKMVQAGIDPSAATLEAATLQRADIDSVALLTEPTLRAWGVPYSMLSNDPEVPEIAQAQAQAIQGQCPVAVLLPFELE